MHQVKDRVAHSLAGTDSEGGGGTGCIFDVQRFSIHDGPGIRTTVFFKGCPLRCHWCHNPESQASQPELMLWPNRCIGCRACLAACRHGAIRDGGEGHRPITDTAQCVACGACVEVCYAKAREMVGRTVTVDEILSLVERDLAFYDQSGGGASFSGGEPLAQPAFLSALLQGCRERGIHTTLDTCGHAPWEVLDRVRGFVDLFLYDLKIVDDARHRQVTGTSNRLILDNLRGLSERGHQIVVRVPVIPGVNDDTGHLTAIAAFAATLPHLAGVALLPYHPTARDKYRRLGRTYDLDDVPPPSQDQLAALATVLRRQGLRVKIGG
jgi:pyruvate formate lyase activating enzyme